MTAKTELLPCPFCGGDAAHDSVSFEFADAAEETEYVVCEICAASTDMCVDMATAASKWNRRLVPPARAVPDPMQLEHLAIDICDEMEHDDDSGHTRYLFTPDDLCDFARALLSTPAEPARAVPTCEYCGGRGEVGGFVNAESGYQTDPCPDCTFVPVPIGLVSRAAGILGSQGLTGWDEISAELRALLGQREG